MKDIRSINISFPIPDVSQHYDSKVALTPVIQDEMLRILFPLLLITVVVREPRIQLHAKPTLWHTPPLHPLSRHSAACKLH